MDKLFINKEQFLDLYFSNDNGNFFNNVYYSLLNEGKFSVNTKDLLNDLDYLPIHLVEGQIYNLDLNGNIDLNNTEIIFE
jgi:hypothetical protein